AAIDGAHVTADAATAVNEDAAVHRFQSAGQHQIATCANGAVHRLDVACGDVVIDADAAVDRFHAARIHAARELDAAVHGFQVAVAGIGGGLDAAVDLADVIVGHCMRCSGGEGQQQEGAFHGNLLGWVFRGTGADGTTRGYNPHLP